MSYSIIIPIYNEVSFLGELLNELNQIKNRYEIIIIDDGSTDGSKKILELEDSIIVLQNKKNYGKGFSIKLGIERANNNNIILMDGDLEVNTKDIPKLINEFEAIDRLTEKAVVGIRWKHLKLYNSNNITFGNYCINKIFNIVFRTSFKDILCCYKVISKQDLKNLNLESNRFSIETEIMSKIVDNNFTIKEVKINYTARTFSEGKKIKTKDSLGILFTMIKQKLKQYSFKI